HEAIKTTRARRIIALDLMSPHTKARAREKVQSLIVGVGYPDTWRGYAGLENSGDDALGNAMRAEEFEYQYRLRELRQPIDRNEWWITPQTVHAPNLP